MDLSGYSLEYNQLTKNIPDETLTWVQDFRTLIHKWVNKIKCGAQVTVKAYGPLVIQKSQVIPDIFLFTVLHGQKGI